MPSSKILSYCTIANVDDWDFNGGTHCVYCRTPLEGWFSPNSHKLHFALPTATARECLGCGWWFVTNAWDDCNTGHKTGTTGILEEFDLASATVPIEVLARELPAHLDKLGTVNPNRMEDYVSHILRGVYDCEVKQLGYSRDGGIDLLVLDNDNPVAVQVKRRRDLTGSESVAGVREFLGASLLAGFDRLLFVTTSKKFSADAVEASRAAVAKTFVASFELIDLGRFTAMIESQERPSNIEIAFSRPRRPGAKVPKVPDPFADLV